MSNATPKNSLQLTDDEACGIARARGLLRLLGDLAEPVMANEKPRRELDRESLALYVRTVEELLPARF